MKRYLSLAAMAVASLTIVACGGGSPEQVTEQAGQVTGQDDTKAEDDDSGLDLSHVSVGVVVNESGINDQSFNQAAWEGLVFLRDETNMSITNIESVTDAAIAPNLDMMLDSNLDLIWAVGFRAEDALFQAATLNPEQMYGIIDVDYGDDILDNIIGVMFRDNESSFLAGYLAARTSETGTIGFVGGMEGQVIGRFEYGFRAGAAYAASKHDLDINVLVQYIGNFSDDAAGRAIATTMYTNGADIIMTAAGSAGQGVIDTAIDMNRLVIGVDRDQSNLAPNNMLTSVIKFVGQAISDVSIRFALGENVGGETLHFGIAEGGVGLAPFEGSTEALVDRQVFEDTMQLKENITDGDIIVPQDSATFEEFKASL